jgi:hypothetical protein
VIEFAALVLAIASEDQGFYGRVENIKALRSLLGIEQHLYKGMPFAGGLPVARFEDGSSFVRLVNQQDFAVVGSSLGTGTIGGEYQYRTRTYDGDSDWFRASREGRIVVFAYVDPQKRPVFVILIEYDRQDKVWRVARYRRISTEPSSIYYSQEWSEKYAPNVLAFLAGFRRLYKDSSPTHLYISVFNERDPREEVSHLEDKDFEEYLRGQNSYEHSEMTNNRDLLTIAYADLVNSGQIKGKYSLDDEEERELGESEERVSVVMEHAPQRAEEIVDTLDGLYISFPFVLGPMQRKNRRYKNAGPVLTLTWPVAPYGSVWGAASSDLGQTNARMAQETLDKDRSLFSTV